MIVPEPRLAFTVGVLSVLAALAYAYSAAAAPFAVLVLLLLALALVLDALRATRRPAPFSVEVPGKAAWLKDVPAELALICTPAFPGPAMTLRVGIPWPAHIALAEEFLSVRSGGDGERIRVHWPVTPRKRGRFLLDTIFADAPSPWGLWRVRHRLNAHCDVHVHPNLGDARHQSAAMFLHRTGAGSRVVRQVGRGREFEQLREYLPGDSFEDIFWKGTARRGKPVTKTYQLEQVQEVYTIIDTSRLSTRDFGAGSDAAREDTYLEHFVSTALLLSAVAGRQHDRFGLATFSSKVNVFLRAGAGRGHFNACRNALTETVATHANPDFEELFIYLRQVLRRRALLVFFTSLDDPMLAEQFCANIHLLSRKHLVVVCLLTPANARPMFSGTPADALEDIYGQLGGHLQWQQLRELQGNLSRQGVSAFLLQKEQLCNDVIEHYLNIKKRQLL
ncbi:MAG: DUF58 domain-containing protein [Candidatus Hydrogenedentes bacterium]|nr:DUF58 domain-containing protein [Candidatus Hydrogenedentota bacterium]